MKKVCALMLMTPRNRNSCAVLGGALEVSDVADVVHFEILSSVNKLINRVKEVHLGYDKIVLCFSFTSLRFADSVKELLKIKTALKSFSINNYITLAGGSHPSGAAEETLRAGFDYVIKGEGEEAFPDFLKSLLYECDPLATKGVCALRDKKYVSNGRAHKVDINKFPAFSKRYNKYTYFEITRGCSTACSYCQTSYLFGNKFRHRNIDYICESAEYLLSQGTKDFRVLTPDAMSYGAEKMGAPDYSKVEELLVNLRKALNGGGLYYGDFPSEIWTKSATDETFELLKKYSDNSEVTIGAQSGSDSMLKKLHRDHTFADVVGAVQTAEKHGFVSSVDFIFGFPDETIDDMRATVELMKEVISYNGKVHSHIFVPLAGTPLAGAEPVDPPVELITELEALTGAGKQYGTWKSQLKKAKEVYALREHIYKYGSLHESLLI